jgi:glutamate-1-semialdehyde 2,1-aminomutase
MMGNQKNLELTEILKQAYIGGHSNARYDVSVTPMKIFVDRMAGARVWDLDGNEYVDYMSALGPIIIGHCHPQYVRGLKDTLDRISPTIGSYVLATEMEIELAEKLKQHIPCAEEIKFAVTGSEIVQLAIRLARAHTKKRYVIRFSGHYHGWFDNVMGQMMDPDPEGMPFGVESPKDFYGTEGKDPEAVKQTFILPWNDIAAVQDCLEKYGDQVAMIHCEVVVFNLFGLMPRPGFLERLKELCERHNVVLSFDEVITGFRVGLGGAQGKFGVTPDIATFGKAIGGGMPVALVAGKRDILKSLEDRTVLGPGTFMGYPLGVAACLETIKILEKDDGAVYREMDRVQERLVTGIEEANRRKGLPMLCQGTTGAFVIVPGVECEVAYTQKDLAGLDFKLLMKLQQILQHEGVITRGGGTFYLTAAHDDADIDFTLEAYRRSLEQI